MSWTLEQSFAYTSAAPYRSRINQAFLKLANDVTNESEATANHEKRLTLANDVINGNGVPKRAYEMLPVLNPGLQVEGGIPTDQDILFTVAQQWNFFAGVDP